MLGRWTQRFAGTRRSPDNPSPVSGVSETSQTGSGQQGDTEAEAQARKRAVKSQLREVLLRTSPHHRWNAAIKPRGKTFKAIVAIFEEKLEEGNTPVQNILDNYFTKHEIDLMVPANKRRNRALARIQRRNRVRYKMLLRSQRFAPWANQATTLKLKLAMLWFGLPVAPIEFDPEDESGSGSDTGDDIAEAKTDARREERAKHENSLRFLNSYGQRYFGRDQLRRPDPTYEAYYAFNSLYPVASKETQTPPRQQPASISLRGGGLSDDLLDMDVADFNESDVDVENMSDTDSADGDHAGESAGISLRGGAGISKAELKKAMELSEQLYVPKEDSGPSVRFRPKPVPWQAESAAVEEANNADTGTGKGKGKEIARDEPAKSKRVVTFASAEPQPVPRGETRRDVREVTYPNPPSVYADNEIPQNAAPIERVLRFGSDNLPPIALGVLTPSEQRKLQIEHYDMRNILLDRSQKCPYRGCDRVFSLAEDDRMQQHLAGAHMGDSCNFCDEVLYHHWTVNQRRAHFLNRHCDLFVDMHHVENDNRFRAGPRPHGQVDWERESRYTWCPRCGRDHVTLNATADREHHDLVCYPGAPEGQWMVCHKCGEIHSITKYHECREVVNTMEWPYCHRCGLGVGQFSELYRGKHLLHCMGFRREDVRRCPWCQRDLEEGAESYNKLGHLTHCYAKPDPAAQGPLDPDTGKPWPYKPPREEAEGEPEQEPPQLCTLCSKTVIQFDAHLLLKHIEDNHADYTDVCIFCGLDYEKRGWVGNRKRILAHLDDHIHDRKVRLAADLVDTLDIPFNHPYKWRALRPRDYEGVKSRREMERYKKLYDELMEASQRQIEKHNEEEQQMVSLRERLLEVERELAETEKALEELKSKAPASTAAATNPFAPAAAASPTPAQKKKENLKPTAARKQAVGSSSSSSPQTPPSNTTRPKRKSTRLPTSARAAADPSYRPTSSDSDTSSDEEFREEEERLRQANKRKRTAQQDPSYRPQPEDKEG